MGRAGMPIPEGRGYGQQAFALGGEGFIWGMETGYKAEYG